MKIMESQVRLESARAYRQSTAREERLQVRFGARQQATGASPIVALQADRVELSEQAQLELRQVGASPAEELGPVEDEHEQKARLVETLLTALLGKKVHIRRLNEKALAKAMEKAAKDQPVLAAPGRRPSETGFALRYDYREVTTEHERLELAFGGTVITGDGETIEFSLQLQMERVHHEEQSLSIRIGEMVDPLVINFGASTAKLTDQRFAFDLTSDGVKEQVPLLSQGSGFLVLDRNGDGRVNDGRELFGTESGDGFGDLAAYDDDGNNWIDEADGVFDQLRVWLQEPEGERLVSLSELGIGALYLGSVSAEFSLQGSDGQLLGQQQRAGLFLRTNKTVGTMQHVDVSV